MRKVETFIEGLCYPKGLRWRNGWLWFSDMYDDRVLYADSEGHVTCAFETPGQPSGIGWLPDNRMLVVSMIDRQVLQVEEGGAFSVHADLSELTEHHCNDMIIDRYGTAYVGNFGFDLRAYHAGTAKAIATRMVQVAADGHARKVGGPVWFPNGAVITPDEETLIVGETFGNRLTAFDIAEGGSLVNQRIWSEFENIRPDGITLDAEGAIWTSSPGTNFVYRIAEGGQILDSIELDQECFGCLLGGDDGRSLFIITATSSVRETCREARSGRIEIATVDVPHAGWP